MSCGAPTCAFFKDKCESCARRRRYGAIVEALNSFRWAAGLSQSCLRMGAERLDALDALAEIMEDRHRLIRAHREEMNDEIRGMQRDASDAYAEGRADGAASER